MAKLQDIVSSVLQDILMAQHEANLIAESLAEEYASSPVLKSFPVPAVSVGEMEITLHFAIVGGEGLRDDPASADVQSMDVIADSSRLAAIDKGSLQTITLKISPKQIAEAEKSINK
jgi:hypothetical protein